jgi:hypothetical protein
MDDLSLAGLPACSSAPEIGLNVHRTPVVSEWLLKRDALFKKWIELKMYNPKATWSFASTAQQKIAMVRSLSH